MAVSGAPVIVVKKQRQYRAGDAGKPAPLPGSAPPSERPDKQQKRQSPPVRHPAKPMTPAQFRRKEWKKTKQIRRLARTFPALWPDFDNGVFRPMKVGIRDQILAYIAEHPDCGLTASQFLAGIMNVVKLEAYYASFAEGAFRYDIHGEPAGTVTAGEAADAARRVKRFRDLRARIAGPAEKARDGTDA